MTSFKKELLPNEALKLDPVDGKCPVCKSELVNRGGDLFCKNHTLNLQTGCVWHRYENGLNYWSPQADVMRALAKEHNIPLPKGFNR